MISIYIIYDNENIIAVVKYFFVFIEHERLNQKHPRLSYLRELRLYFILHFLTEQTEHDVGTQVEGTISREDWRLPEQTETSRLPAACPCRRP